MNRRLIGIAAHRNHVIEDFDAVLARGHLARAAIVIGIVAQSARHFFNALLRRPRNAIMLGLTVKHRGNRMRRNAGRARHIFQRYGDGLSPPFALTLMQIAFIITGIFRG